MLMIIPPEILPLVNVSSRCTVACNFIYLLLHSTTLMTGPRGEVVLTSSHITQLKIM